MFLWLYKQNKYTFVSASNALINKKTATKESWQFFALQSPISYYI